MKRYTTPFLAILFALACGSFATGALADDVSCPPYLGAVTIDGNVIVDNGACLLDGTTVKGNVHVYPGGSLTAKDAFIDGNIQAEGAGYVRVIRTDVIGDIQLDNVMGDTSKVSHSAVDGNIQLNSNYVSLVVQRNVVDGDVQAFSNSGGVKIRYNIIDGNLQCKSNRPAPTGGFNRVSGNKEDQCARL